MKRHCRVTKLGTLTNAKYKDNPMGMYIGEVMEGYTQEPPKVGEGFILTGDSQLFTSLVKSVYIKGTEQDKLVIPEFAIDFDLSNVKLEQGDIMFSTNNSLYAVNFVCDKEEATALINNLYDDCMTYESWDKCDPDNWEAMRESLHKLASYARLTIDMKQYE